MGDRYTITADKSEILERYNIESDDRYTPKYNAGPTQVLPILTQGSKGLSFFYWGQIPDRAKNRSISTKLIHVESESILQKVSSRNALMSRRCVIPADGYYDWKKISKKGRIPYRFVFNNNGIVSLAGIWEEFEDENEDIVHTFKILTTPSNDVVRPISSRMPLVLEEEEEKIWLDKNSTEEDITALFNTYNSEKMTYYSVSPQIEDLSLNDAFLIKPSAPADQFGNYSLFD